MNTKGLSFIALALAYGLAMPAQAATLDIVTGNDFAPYADEKLPNGGFATDLVREVIKKIGTETNIRFLPWKRGYELTTSGETLATFPYVKNPDREAVMLFSEPLYIDISRIFSVKTNPVPFTGEESLKGKTICNPAGYVVYPMIKAGLEAKTLRLQEPGDMQTCVKFLELGRADFIISSLPVMRTISENLGLTEKLTWAEKPFRESPNFLIVGKNTPGGAEFLKKFNTGLAAYRNSPAYAELAKKHGLDGAVK
jgi:polar amino acid transport system substrate-binding protein